MDKISHTLELVIEIPADAQDGTEDQALMKQRLAEVEQTVKDLATQLTGQAHRLPVPAYVTAVVNGAPIQSTPNEAFTVLEYGKEKLDNPTFTRNIPVKDAGDENQAQSGDQLTETQPQPETNAVAEGAETPFDPESIGQEEQTNGSEGNA